MPRKSTSIVKRVRKLERVSRPEVKHHRNYSGEFDTVGSLTGTLLNPMQLTQGTGRGYRIGDKVKSRNIRFQCIVKMPSLAANPTCAVRVLVLRSKISNPTTSDMPSWYTPVDEDKFFVVKDVITQVSQMGTRNAGGGGDSFSTGSTLRRFNFNINTGMRKLQYDGNGPSPLNNEYIIYMLAENQSAECAYYWRHYFIDN